MKRSVQVTPGSISGFLWHNRVYPFAGVNGTYLSFLSIGDIFIPSMFDVVHVDPRQLGLHVESVRP